MAVDYSEHGVLGKGGMPVQQVPETPSLGRLSNCPCGPLSSPDSRLDFSCKLKNGV